MKELKKLLALAERNTKSYFKDKVTFFMSLITPLILLLLFVTFLRGVYTDSFKNILKECGYGELISADGMNGIFEGMAGATLMSSILGVSAVTVAFCSNVIMVDDKINSYISDFKVSPVKSVTVSLAYYVSNFFVTLIIMLCVAVIGFIYIGAVGWHLSVGDVFMILLACICNVLFGTLLAGVVENFISTQGGMSAVATLVSSMYGFISGAYMPISSFGDGLRNVLSLLPGTYGTGIFRNHFMNGYMDCLAEKGISPEAIKGLENGFDVNLYVFDNNIPLGAMYGILLGTCAILLAVYVSIIIIKNKRK